ncbi:MAG TPA: enoyl-CoA hydratase/isomerase family protein, partial [Gammaproteobacteria bacterium]|nr:enoyl-CoA hydratase/isomerase family protein [Gammaproteobacteria bacterium]
MTDYQHIIVDSPLESVSRITLNRPDSRNALNNVLRG